MKQKVIIIVVLCIMLASFFPLSVMAQDKPDNYVVARMGKYNTTGDLDDYDFKGKENAELMFGHYFSPNFVLEGGFGVIINEWKEAGVEIDIDGLSLLLTAKGVYPMEKFEFFGGGGIGLYKGQMDIYGIPLFHYSEEETVFGFHIMIGASYDITQNWYLALEAKHHWTQEADYKADLPTFPGVKTDLNGYGITLGIGWRF